MPKQKPTVDSQLEKLTALIAVEHAKFKAAVSDHIAAVLEEYGLTLADLKLADLPPPAKAVTRKAVPEKVTPKKGAAKSQAIRIEPKPRDAKRKPAFQGTQPPKYRDPETEATWSGFGRAPAWIKDADRSQFLINGAG
jgi:DNA-binding protein H-NS